MIQNKMNLMRKETIKSIAQTFGYCILYLDENGLHFIYVLFTNIISTIVNLILANIY